MPTQTTNYGLNKPLVNNATDEDLWGGYLNGDMDSIDGLIETALNWTASSSQTGTITVNAPSSGTTATGSSRMLYICNATSGAFAANLPDVSTCSGMSVAFKKTDSSANAVTITANGTDKIDGSGTFSLNGQYSFLVISSDGTSWDILSSTPPSIQSASTTVAGILKTATAALALAGTDAATALTPAAFAGNNSIVNNGYYQFPGGLIIQWGVSGNIASGQTASVNYPTPFLTTALNVNITPSQVGISSAQSAVKSIASLSSFSLENATTVNQQFYFIAIGK